MPSYSDDFKREAVRLVAAEGRPLKRVARELGVSAHTLRAWRYRYAPDEPPASEALPAEEQIRRLRRELDQVRQERDILKKSRRHLLADAAPPMKHAFVRLHASEHPVTALCRVLRPAEAEAGVSRSGYYAWGTRPESEHACADQALSALIAEAHVASRRTYGAPRVHAELQARGHRVSRKRVARLMRRAGLRGATPRRKYRRALASAPEAPDLVRRQFRAEAPDRV